MSDTPMKLQWEEGSLIKFNSLIERIPLFHRDIAREVVIKQAEINTQERNSSLVEESDIVRAFFSEVPAAFYSLMIKLLGDVGFDYEKYEAT